MEPCELAGLIEAAQRRDPQAFDALIDAYARPLYGYLYRLTGAREDAEDLLQEVFVRVVRMIGQYEHDGRFEAWLFRIATNLVRDRVRRIRRAPVTSSLDAGGDGFVAPDGEAGDVWVDSSAPAPDGRLTLREDVDALQQALARLAPAEREVLMLRHFAQLSFAEIATAMGTPLGTALARAHRGLIHLRELMEHQR
ncbi:MAG TPA: sigma-70 family RNA polymerase sigma factor [Phycisphaerae bacterium]|jgi:RNA polymerase sigma-70 factor (ECF subfamily)